MNLSNSKPLRHHYFDLITGFFMIQIIVMHILQLAGKYDDNVIFSPIMHLFFFFMPWFYFKSGYFFKPVEKINKNYISGKFKKLLIPFISFSIIGLLITFPMEVYEAQRPIWRILLSFPFSILRDGSGGAGNLPIWFLLSLFFTIISFALLDKLNLKWLIVTFPFLGFILFYYKIELPLGFTNFFLAVFFYGVGNVFRKVENSRYYILTSIFSIAIYITSQFYCFSSLDFRTHELLTGYYFIYIISSIAGLIIIYRIGKVVNFIKPINYIGQNSMAYFVIHWPILILVKTLFKIFSIHSMEYAYAIILTLAVFIATPFFIKWLPYKYKFLIGN